MGMHTKALSAILKYMYMYMYIVYVYILFYHGCETLTKQIAALYYEVNYRLPTSLR